MINEIRIRRVLGVDLGQANDYTALALFEMTPHSLDEYVDKVDKNGELYREKKLELQMNLRYLQRPNLMTDYVKITEIVEGIYRSAPSITDIVVDATGVGRPIVDMLLKRGVKVIPVTITGGLDEGTNDLGFTVPKRGIVSNLARYIHEDRIRVARGLPLWEVLRQELLTFKAQRLGTAVKFEADWRSTEHDDLVLAAALAIWWGDRTKDGKIRLVTRKEDPIKYEEQQMYLRAVAALTPKDEKRGIKIKKPPGRR